MIQVLDIKLSDLNKPVLVPAWNYIADTANQGESLYCYSCYQSGINISHYTFMLGYILFFYKIGHILLRIINNTFISTSKKYAEKKILIVFLMLYFGKKTNKFVAMEGETNLINIATMFLAGSFLGVKY